MPHNILMIAADDLCHVGRMLSVLIRDFHLPNLRRLAESGTDFDRAYCVVPLCEPARAAVMSGLSPAETRSFDLTVGWRQIIRPENLWTYRLRRSGYYMGTIGKVFHGYRPQPGFVYEALYDTPPFQIGRWQPSGMATEHGGQYGRGWDNDTDWYDYAVASQTIDHIRNFDQDRPWYWETGFFRPHVPFWAPNRCFNAIDLDRVILPQDWHGGFEKTLFANSFVTADQFSAEDPADWSEEEVLHTRKTIRNYAAGALFMDEQLGRILDALEDSRFRDNTVVAFYSDHGYHLGDHNAWHKFTLYEQAACAPFIIRVPNQTPRVVASPVSHIDLGATLLDVAGLPKPVGHRGESLMPWIRGETPEERAIPTFWYGSVSCAIGMKRVTLYQDGSGEMFDIAGDPWAKKNIAEESPEFPELRDRVLKTCAEWQFLLVDDRGETDGQGQFTSFMGSSPTVPRISTSFATLGDVVPAKGRSPGYQRMYGAPEERGGTVKLPAHVNDFHTMGRMSATMTLIGNDLGNTIRIEEAHHHHFVAELGDGDNRIMPPGNIRVTARGGTGNDTLRAGMRRGNKLFGGAGDDLLIGGAGSSYLDGGAGNDLLQGGAGNDTLISGPGDDTLQGNAGDNLLILDAGKTLASGGPGRNTFKVYRTGERNVITDFKAGDILDLSDWAGIQPVILEQVADRVRITAACEKLICDKTTLEVIRRGLRGVDHA